MICIRNVAEDETNQEQPADKPNEAISCRKIEYSKISKLSRWGHTAVYYKEHLIVFGGRREEDKNDMMI